MEPNEKPRFPLPPDQLIAVMEANTRKVEVKGHHVTKMLIRLLVIPFRKLSWEGAYKFGSAIGRLLARLRIRRDVAMTNLDIVYGNRKTPAEKEAFYRACLENFGRQMVNYLRAPLLADETLLQENYELINFELVDQAYNRGKGVLFIWGHHGAWEMPAAAVNFLGYPVSLVGKKIKNPVVDQFTLEARNTLRIATFNHRDSMKKILASLRRGEGAIMVVDQNMKRSQGVFVDFMGRIASTIRSSAYIARETGATVLTGYSIQTGPKRFRLEVTEEIPYETDPDPERELLLNTKKHAAAYGRVIYAHPEDWFWLHRRWKVQPEGVPNPYDKK